MPYLNVFDKCNHHSTICYTTAYWRWKTALFFGNQNDGIFQHDKKSSCFNTTELSRARTSKCWKGFDVKNKITRKLNENDSILLLAMVET
jgi:hypothetical protein